MRAIERHSATVIIDTLFQGAIGSFVQHKTSNLCKDIVLGFTWELKNGRNSKADVCCVEASTLTSIDSTTAIAGMQRRGPPDAVADDCKDGYGLHMPVFPANYVTPDKSPEGPHPPPPCPLSLLSRRENMLLPVSLLQDNECSGDDGLS